MYIVGAWNGAGLVRILTKLLAALLQIDNSPVFAGYDAIPFEREMYRRFLTVIVTIQAFQQDEDPIVLQTHPIKRALRVVRLGTQFC